MKTEHTVALTVASIGAIGAILAAVVSLDPFSIRNDDADPVSRAASPSPIISSVQSPVATSNEPETTPLPSASSTKVTQEESLERYIGTWSGVELDGGRVEIDIDPGIGKQMGTSKFYGRYLSDPTCVEALTFKSLKGDLLKLTEHRAAGSCADGTYTLRFINDQSLKYSWTDKHDSEGSRSAEVTLERE